MDKQELQDQLERAGSLSELSRQLGIPYQRLRYRAMRLGVHAKSGFKSPKTVRRNGPEHHNWKGGTYEHSNGYLYELCPDHPCAVSAKGYVLQHRLVMERHLGRYLLPHELVHHINENKQDNRIENLQIIDQSTHVKLHKETAQRYSKGKFLK